VSQILLSRLSYLCSQCTDTEKGNDGNRWLDLEGLIGEPNQQVELSSMVEVQNRYSKHDLILTQILASVLVVG
jgi:hypothetical protein